MLNTPKVAMDTSTLRWQNWKHMALLTRTGIQTGSAGWSSNPQAIWWISRFEDINSIVNRRREFWDSCPETPTKKYPLVNHRRKCMMQKGIVDSCCCADKWEFS